MRAAFAILAAGVALAAYAATAPAADLITYGASGYRYCFCPYALGQEDPNFDDSSWSVGRSAFGSALNGCATGTLGTQWGLSQDLVVRKHFTLSAEPVNVELHLGYSTRVDLYINGRKFCALVQRSCGELEDAVIVVPDGWLSVGSNVIVAVPSFFAAGAPFFDMRLTGDGAVATESRSWGELKASYR